jgi:hypothetical protein
LDPTLAVVEERTPSLVRYRDRIRLNGKETAKVLFEENGPVVFTKEYVRHGLLSKKIYKQGTSGLITRVHSGLLGGITHVDVRLKDGEFVREVPVDYFLA